MKKFQYVTSILVTLGMCGVMGYAPEVWGQEVNDKETALAPLVMVIVDTSGSMNAGFGSGYTRLTKALAEMAGSPKVSTPSYISSRYSGSYYLPRAYRDCSSGTCQFKYQCKKMGGNIAKIPDMKTGESACTDNPGSFYDRYHENGVMHSYMETVKFGFAGLYYSSYWYGEKVEQDGNYEYGVKINTSTYKYKKNGVYSGNRAAQAPLLYPTPSDDVNEIRENNKAVITSLRSYYETGGTPLGPALADMYFLFTTPDPGLIKQPKGDSFITDDLYDCRKKAVILISDGEPGGGRTGTGEMGQSTRVWEDAERLYNEGIRVYAVTYAQNSTSVDLERGLGKTMNWVAWKGGTCRDEHGNEIGPNDVDAFNALVKAKRSCMFNAGESNALRTALVTVLSDMLEGTKSKTAVATTTAIGQKDNFREGKWHNGYYNVYSGYKVTMGPVRDTVLQRTAITCNHGTGFFEVDDNQYLDISKRLKCRIRGEANCGGLENTRYASPPDGCVYRNEYNYAGTDAPEPVSSLTGVDKDKMSCLKDAYDNDERYIFTANYVDVESKQIPRYAISNFKRNSEDHKILKNINIKDHNREKAGLLKKALNSEGVVTESTAKDANFFLQNNTLGIEESCAVQMAKKYDDQLGKPNYILSPYECGADFDCGTVGESNKPRLCDIGRCIDPGDFATKQGCNSNPSDSTGNVCVGNYLRKKYTGSNACETHNDCLNHADFGSGFVCHAARCLPGTVKGCDVRHFLASVPLGTIEHATPVPVAPPTKAYKSLTYQNFSTRYWKRDSMLMVAANDGMLHAFVLGDNQDGKDYTSGTYDFTKGLDLDDTVNLAEHKSVDVNDHEGDELWRFIPKMSYKNLYNLVDFGDQDFLNARPVVSDVRLPGLTIDGDSWRTVLVGGFRDGGRGYYALDITNPAKPFVLWEIDNQWQPWSNNVEYPSVYSTSIISIDQAIENRTNLRNKMGYPFQLMGYSYAEPVITNLLIDGRVEPVAILAGGQSLSINPESDMVGRALYIVKLFPNSNEDLIVKIFYFDEPITGTPEVYPNNFNSIAQHIYVGDAKGSLYRLTVSADFNTGGKYEDSSVWASYQANGGLLAGDTIKIVSNSGELTRSYQYEKPIFDPSIMTGLGATEYGAITFKPAVSLLGYLDETKDPAIQITYGTGSNDNFNVAENELHYIASFIDMPYKGYYQLNPEISPCFKPQIFVFNSSAGTITSGDKTDTHVGTQKYTIYTADPVSKTGFAPYQKLTGAPITHYYKSYFPTFVALSDPDKPCTNGHANIWRMSPRITCSDIPDYNNPEEGVQNKINSDVFGDSSVVELSKGTRIYGLELTNQMYCIADCEVDLTCDPESLDCCQNRVLAPQLIAQTGVDTASLATDKGSIKLTSGKVEVASLAINLEAFKPEVSRVTWAGVYE